jgi:hypothetical protein
MQMNGKSSTAASGHYIAEKKKILKEELVFYQLNMIFLLRILKKQLQNLWINYNYSTIKFILMDYIIFGLSSLLEKIREKVCRLLKS